MTKLNFRIAPVGESTLVDENIESSLRSAMPRDAPHSVGPSCTTSRNYCTSTWILQTDPCPYKLQTHPTYETASKKNHVEPPTDHEYFHCLGEISNTEQSRKSNAALGSSKSKSSNLPMSNPTTLSQTENEFSWYLDAIANPISVVAQTVFGGRERVTGNKVRSFLHSEEGCSRNNVAPNSFQHSSIPSVPNNNNNLIK